jgi:hypothetical protein
MNCYWYMVCSSSRWTISDRAHPITIFLVVGHKYAYTPPHETLAAASSRPNSKALVARVVLAHLHVAFHPCMCGLHGGTNAVAAVLIGYDDVEIITEMTTRRRRSWTTTSSTLMHYYVRLLLQLFFHCSACPVVTIDDLLLASILGWHRRSSASVTYPFPYSGIRAVLHSSWYESCTMVICDGY